MALLAKPSFTPGFYFRVTFTLLKLKWAGILTCSYMFIHIERCSCSSNYRWKIMNCKDLTFAKKVTHTHTHTRQGLEGDTSQGIYSGRVKVVGNL